MARIHQIPVVVVNDRVPDPAPAGPTTPMALAILNEIEAKLEALAEEGEESTIDLRWLIGLPRDLDLLRNTLGQGEVAATITSVGRTLIQETAVPCVWWVSHRDYDNRPLGEFVEISEVPELLRSDRLSINQGLVELRARSALLDTPDAFSCKSSTSGSQS